MPKLKALVQEEKVEAFFGMKFDSLVLPVEFLKLCMWGWSTNSKAYPSL